MANGKLPGYLASAKPNPSDARAPWYKNTAPSFAGIFLTVPFMSGMFGALKYGSVWAGFIGLVVGALFCFLLYYIPGRLGQETGMPLYVVSSSTFGTHGAVLLPNLLMGVLQVGWHAVFTFSAATFFMSALGKDPSAQIGTPLFWVFCVAWGLFFAFVGAVGLKWLGWLSSWIPIFPLVMIIVAGFANADGLKDFEPALSLPENLPVAIPALGLAAFMTLQAAAGFFATAGAGGADFGTGSRNHKDVVLGGLFGITIAGIVAGGFALLTMAGAIGKNPELAATLTTTNNPAEFFALCIGQVGGYMSKVTFWVFVIACICPTGFCAFLAANAFSTMLPKLPRVPLTLAAGVVGLVLAATGVAMDLVGFFLLIGASFGPIVGIMTADFLRSGKWSGPRQGVNLAGYISWAVGLFVGLLGKIPAIGFSYELSTLMSFIVGFALFLILSECGLEPKKVEMPSSAPAEEPTPAPAEMASPAPVEPKPPEIGE